MRLSYFTVWNSVMEKMFITWEENLNFPQFLVTFLYKRMVNYLSQSAKIYSQIQEFPGKEPHSFPTFPIVMKLLTCFRLKLKLRLNIYVKNFQGHDHAISSPISCWIQQIQNTKINSSSNLKIITYLNSVIYISLMLNYIDENLTSNSIINSIT